MRAAWTRIFYALKPDQALTGVAFQIEPLTLSGRDTEPLPRAVYDKARADGVIVEKLGPKRLWAELKDLWPQGAPHLPIADLWGWFAAYVYMPKLRDRVVLDAAIREAVAELDPAFGYADAVAPSGAYSGLRWASAPPDLVPSGAVLVNGAIAAEEVRRAAPFSIQPMGDATGRNNDFAEQLASSTSGSSATGKSPPRRFYGSVEIDVSARPMKSFETVLNAVVLELQNVPGAKVMVTLEIEAEAPDGFKDADIGVVRDNARQLEVQDGVDRVRVSRAITMRKDLRVLAQIEREAVICQKTKSA